MGEESENKEAKRQRPGGRYKPRPIEINGKFYDGLNPPKMIRTPEGKEDWIGGTELDRDEVYSQRFWDRNQPPGLKEVMIDNIHRAASGSASIGSFVSSKGLEEKDKEKLSAYRLLAKELGYEVGQYTVDSKTDIASAPIRKIPKSEQ